MSDIPEYSLSSEQNKPEITDVETLVAALREASSFATAFEQLEDDLLDFFEADRLTVYKATADGHELVSWFTSGRETPEIRLSISPHSIAGYVASTHRPLKIDDVYDADALTRIHPNLEFNYNIDFETGYLTKAMLVVPLVVNESLQGVLQLVNKRVDSSRENFTNKDFSNAQTLAVEIANKLQYEEKSSRGPFDLLIDNGQITRERLAELAELATKTDTPLTHILTSACGIEREDIGASLEQYFQVPYLAYDSDIEVDKDLLASLNPEYLVRKQWLPLGWEDNTAVIAIDNPNDFERITDIQNLINAAAYRFYVACPEDILRFLGVQMDPVDLSNLQAIADNPHGQSDRDGGQKQEESQPMQLEDLLGQLEEDEGVTAEADEQQESGELIDENASAVIQLVNNLIRDAIIQGASDIHIEPRNREPADVRYRIDGVCRNVLQIPRNHTKPVVARVKIMAQLDITENRVPQDGKLRIRLKDGQYDLRVATLPTVNGESVVLRVLSSSNVMPFDKLNLSDRNYREIEELIHRPHGIFLVVGPTGSGKSTTLHAMLARINTPDQKIWTAEDPVEITQPGLQQVQVNPKIRFDFARALRAFLRADPDVVLIGEMRDFETAHSGIEASLTGHLVFSTLHTNSAPETVTRLLDIGLDPLNFADALIGVLAQRLVRTLCDECKEPYTMTDDEYRTLLVEAEVEDPSELGVKPEQIQTCRPVGCPRCGDSGYKGRTGIHELLVATRYMKSLISRRENVDSVRNQAIEDGMRTLVQDGVAKILHGQTDFTELRKVAASEK